MSPFIIDIFLLDVMTEFLNSPLYFLSYLNRRCQYAGKVLASHELTVLSYHLKQNLWINEENTLFQLGDDLCADLDVSMMARREGIPGKSTPEGILTFIKNKVLGKLLQQIENMEDPGSIDLGFMILTLSEETVRQIDSGLQTILKLANKDKQHHDLTVGINGGSTGLTIHCNKDPRQFAASRLRSHCERRKYTEKASSWFGICLDPVTSDLRLGLKLAFPWEKSDQMDAIVKDLPKGKNIMEQLAVMRKIQKVGRNDPCPCGSGLKFKKCCIDR